MHLLIYYKPPSSEQFYFHIGILVRNFRSLLAMHFEQPNLGKYLLGAFDFIGLYPVNIDIAVEWILQKSMES